MGIIIVAFILIAIGTFIYLTAGSSAETLLFERIQVMNQRTILLVLPYLRVHLAKLTRRITHISHFHGPWIFTQFHPGIAHLLDCEHCCSDGHLFPGPEYKSDSFVMPGRIIYILVFCNMAYYL